MAKKSEKTNALRLLDKLKIPYEAHSYPCEEFTGGEDVARQLGLDPAKVQELCYYTGTERTIAGDCWYHLVGRVLKGAPQPGEYPYDLAEGFSVGFKNPCDLLPEDFPRPCCQMNFGFVLPWVLEEPNPYR